MVVWLWIPHFSGSPLLIGVVSCLCPCNCIPHFSHLILHLLPLWSSDAFPIIVLCVNGPPSSPCTATVDSVGKKGILLWVSMPSFDLGCPIRLLLSLSHNTSCPMNLCSMSLATLLKRSVARSGNSELIDHDQWSLGMIMTLCDVCQVTCRS